MVKLMVQERGRQDVQAAMAAATVAAASRVAYVESRAFIGRLSREGRSNAREAARARAMLEALWNGLAVVDLDAELASSAGGLAERHGLRSMDAIHLASAVRLAAMSREPTSFATFDTRLADAARRQGLRPVPD